MITVPRCLSLLSIVLAAGVGCSKGVSLTTVPVSGKVTLDGQPLAGATVIFQAQAPAGATAPPAPATGVTGADGSYKLATMASGAKVVDGAPPGTYKVTVTKSTAGGAMAMSGDQGLTPEQMAQKMSSMSPEDSAKMAGGAAQPGQGSEPPKSQVPERYGKPDESGLTATVASGGTQTFDFPLTSE